MAATPADVLRQREQTESTTEEDAEREGDGSQDCKAWCTRTYLRPDHSSGSRGGGRAPSISALQERISNPWTLSKLRAARAAHRRQSAQLLNKHTTLSLERFGEQSPFTHSQHSAETPPQTPIVLSRELCQNWRHHAKKMICSCGRAMQQQQPTGLKV